MGHNWGDDAWEHWNAIPEVVVHPVTTSWRERLLLVALAGWCAVVWFAVWWVVRHGV